MTTLVIDVGGTKVSHAHADETELHDVQKIASDGDVLDTLGRIIFENAPGCDAISIGWAGWVSPDGKIFHSPHLPVQEFELLAHVAKISKLPLHLDNDANLFALAEAHHRDEKHTLIGIPIGTGIGAGIAHHGKIFRGSRNFAGEIGHQHLGALSAEKWFAGLATDLPEHVDERIPMFADWLSSLALAFDPSVIVLGGSVGMHVWRPHLPELQDAIAAQWKNFPTPPHVTCTDDEHAVLRGAALAAS